MKPSFREANGDCLTIIVMSVAQLK